MTESSYQGKTWTDLTVVANKAIALKRFIWRKHALLDVVGGYVSESDVLAFHTTVARWKGTFLLLDAGEIFAMSAGDHESHAVQFAQIFSAIDQIPSVPAAILSAATNYSHRTAGDPSSIFGYTSK